MSTVKELGISRDLDIHFSEDIKSWSAEQVRGHQIEVGERERKRLANRKEFPHKKGDYRTVVDNKYDRPVDTVKDYGVFEYVRTATMPEILQKAVKLIRKISPRVTGQYASNNIIMLNGKELPLDSIDSITLDPSDTIQLVNVSEYARKIEGYDIAGGGTTKSGKARKRKPLSSQAPQGVYRLTARLLKQEFGKTAYIKYQMRTLESGRTVGVSKGRYAGSRRANRYPMIRISFSSGTKI